MIPLKDTQPSASFPLVTIALIAINTLVFFYEISLNRFELNHFVTQYGMIPARFSWPDVVTSMFLHGGWMHLIGNMWFLWIFGDNVEDILGKAKYLLFYLLGGAAAALAQAMLMPDSRVPTVGASGAIAGVMGAYLVKFPHSRILTLVPVFVFLTTVEIPAALMLIYWFVIQFFSGLGSVAHSNVSQGGIAWFAHIGGFLAGVLLIFLMRPAAAYRHRGDLHW